jgi:EAL domain-containing protein (putative c-di-GMP-specific phosphodiesterase class I)
MLSQRLNVGVIAEGVETKTLYDQLNGLGCEYGQGYYFSKPQDQDHVSIFLAEHLYARA